jgi:hypothetical protein
MFDTVIEATYNGADGSLGYKKGERYKLIVHRDTIRRVDNGNGRCPYTSLESFFVIWTDIQITRKVYDPKSVDL